MIDEKKLIDETQKYFVNNSIHKNDLAEVIANLPKVGEWIPCSERLPEAEGEYLCSLYYAIPPYNLFHPENDIYIHTISIQKFDGTSFKSSVIAWMPLPPAYKEGE